jgi:hypothetical protein
MAVEEYLVIAESQDEGPVLPKLTWNGAAANCEISEPVKGKPVKKATIVRVQAESATEALNGVKQCFPTLINGTTYGILKSSLTSV